MLADRDHVGELEALFFQRRKNNVRRHQLRKTRRFLTIIGMFLAEDASALVIRQDVCPCRYIGRLRDRRRLGARAFKRGK